jgi:hypothetical protein
LKRRAGANIKLKPYIVGSMLQAAIRTAITMGDAGFDAKFGVTSGLTFDFTYNTDFSQVEADEQQINLSRSVFFSESATSFWKLGIFQFGTNQGAGLAVAGAVVEWRRAGGSPTARRFLFFHSRNNWTVVRRSRGDSDLSGRPFNESPWRRGLTSLLNIQQRETRHEQTDEFHRGPNPQNVSGKFRYRVHGDGTKKFRTRRSTAA